MKKAYVVINKNTDRIRVFSNMVAIAEAFKGVKYNSLHHAFNPRRGNDTNRYENDNYVVILTEFEKNKVKYLES